MYKLTKKRLQAAKPILDQFEEQLRIHRFVVVGQLESELRRLWGIGYQELKDVFIDMLKQDIYAELAVYYMENSNGGSGVVSEFQRPLAKVYGVPHYHHAEREQKKEEYWAQAFA